MMTAREDEMNDRIRFLESEMAGEKVVTRHILEKTQRNGDDIATVRTDITRLDLKIDRMANDVAVVKGAQMGQGTMLNILVQDVREMRTRLEAFEQGITIRFDAVDTRFDAIDTRFDAVDTRFSTIDTRFDAMDARFSTFERDVMNRFNAMDTRFDAIERAIAAIHAALTQRNPQA
jgi:flagellar capping protein FliD